MSARIQVVGGGSWGLALARLLALQGHAVRLWCRAEDEPGQLRQTRRSPFYLRDILTLPDTVEVDAGIDRAADIAVFAVPSHAMRAAAGQHRFEAHTLRVSVAKGIENDTLLRMSEVLTEAGSGGPVVAVSGPTHAEEVARDQPASLVAASADVAAAERVQQMFMGPALRVYSSDDLVGVELGGALKNVIAVAAGVGDGLGLGENARAALITRGLAEMTRLGEALGASPLTFAGLSGMGDLIVTCSSSHSRNHQLGVALAEGQMLEDLQRGARMVAEGVRTARSVHDLAARAGVEMPICEAVYRVLFEQESPMVALDKLMMRAAKPERSRPGQSEDG